MAGRPRKFKKGISFSGWGEEISINYFREKKIPLGSVVNDHYLMVSALEETPFEKKRKEIEDLLYEIESKRKDLKIRQDEFKEMEKEKQEKEQQEQKESENKAKFHEKAFNIFEKSIQRRKGQPKSKQQPYIYPEIKLQWKHLGELNPKFKNKNYEIEEFLNQQPGRILDPEKCRKFVDFIIGGGDSDS